MAEGTGGVPGLPTFDMSKNQNLSTDVSTKNIFDLIKQGYSQSMTSVLPYVQAQYSEAGKAAEPQYSGILRGGEAQAASAQSDAGARGLRGSDIEAAGMQSARQGAQDNVASLRSQLAVAQANSMAEKIMTSYGYDLNQNTQLYTNLSQAIAQRLQQQEELAMREKELAEYKKAQKQKGKNDILGSLISAAGTVGGAYVGFMAGGPAGAVAGANAGSGIAKSIQGEDKG